MGKISMRTEASLFCAVRAGSSSSSILLHIHPNLRAARERKGGVAEQRVLFLESALEPISSFCLSRKKRELGVEYEQEWHFFLPVLAAYCISLTQTSFVAAVIRLIALQPLPISSLTKINSWIPSSWYVDRSFTGGIPHYSTTALLLIPSHLPTIQYLYSS